MSDNPTYDKAMQLLNAAEALEKEVMPIIDPLMADVVTRGFEAIKTVLSTTFNAAPLSPEAIDSEARGELDIKFPRG